MGHLVSENQKAGILFIVYYNLGTWPHHYQIHSSSGEGGGGWLSKL